MRSADRERTGAEDAKRGVRNDRATRLTNPVRLEVGRKPVERGQRVEAIERTGGEWRLKVGDETWICETLVNCGGFWANDVANMIGARLPITNMEHHYLVTENIPAIAGARAAKAIPKESGKAMSATLTAAIKSLFQCCTRPLNPPLGVPSINLSLFF